MRLASSRKGYVKTEDLSRTLKLNDIKLSEDRYKALTTRFDNGGKIYYREFANWLFLDESDLANLHSRIRCSLLALANRGVDWKRVIQNLDKKMRGTISPRAFSKEVDKVGLPVNEAELRALHFRYDNRGDGEKFDYRLFLSQVTKRGDKSMQEQDKARKKHRRDRKEKAKKAKFTLIDSELQRQLQQLLHNQRKLTGEIDSVQKEFQKVDPEGKGRVSKKDFAKLMHQWKIPLTGKKQLGRLMTQYSPSDFIFVHLCFGQMTKSMQLPKALRS